MANEIQYRHYDTGDTLYAVFQNEAGQVWNLTDTPAYETVSSTNWPAEEYGTVLGEIATNTQQYQQDVPTGLDVGIVRRLIFVRLGGTQALSDYTAADEWLMWDGTAFTAVPADMVAINGDLTNGNNASLLLKKLDIRSGGSASACVITSDEVAVSLISTNGNAVDITASNGFAISATNGILATNFYGDLSGSVGSVSGDTKQTGDMFAAHAELAAVPAANASLADKIEFLLMRDRNKQVGTSSAETVANDAGATVGTAALSDASGTTTKEKFA